MMQVREQFTAFVTEHPDGKMDKKDFREMIQKVRRSLRASSSSLSPQALPKEDAEKMEKHMFRVYDSNDDGHVDFVEFMVVASPPPPLLPSRWFSTS